MAIALTGTGGLFTRLGLIFGSMKNLWGLVGNTAPSPGSAWGASGPTVGAMGTCATDITAQYQSTLQGLVGGVTSSSLPTIRGAFSGWITDMVNLSNNTIIQMANNDTPLAVLDVPHAMQLLINQMLANANTVTRNTPTITSSAISGNTGNPNAVVSFVGTNGVNLQYVYPETLVCLVTNDSGNSATKGSEPYQILGTAADSNGPLDWAWPLGSGSSKTGNIIDPNLNAQTSGNILTNSAWGSWTGSTPNNWHITVNAAAISKDVGNVYGAAVADLAFTSTGAEVPSLYQAFGTDTAPTLQPNTAYSGSMIIKLSATTVGGAVAIELTDGSGTVVNDAASTANQKITTLTNQTTNTLVTFTFRTPAVTPSNGYRLQLRISTAMDTGKSLYVNYLALTPATQLYTQGPYFNLFRGSTDVVINDGFNIAVTNTYAGLFQTMFFRVFPMNQIAATFGQKYGYLPQASSGTISDTLVTV